MDLFNLAEAPIPVVQATMATTDRIGSPSSSLTAAEPYDDNEKMSEGRLKTPDEMDLGGDDIERAELLSEHDDGDEKPAPAPKPDTSTRTAVIWMVVNTLATIGIVCSAESHLRSHIVMQYLISIYRCSRIKPSSRTLP